MEKVTVSQYRTQNGRVPFRDWLNKIEWTAKKRVEIGINKLRLGYLSDCKHLKSGVWEMRLHFGPGYRIYFSRWENQILLLLCAGHKGTQKKDINKALEYWLDFKRRMQ